jgi:outer membrane lipoprotein-sorting protein
MNRLAKWMLRFLLSVLPFSLCSAQTPSGAEIFARSLKSYRDFRTLQLEVEWSYSMDGMDAGIPSSELLSDRIAAVIEPGANHIRIESKEHNKLFITDGTNHYRYDGGKKEYSRMAAPPNLDGLMLREVWSYPEGMEFRGEPVVRGNEKVKIKGTAYDCWVLEAPIAFTGSGANPYLVPEPIKIWIDKSSGLPLKTQIIRHMPNRALAIDSMKVTSFKLNESVPPGFFTFEIPKNAREINQTAASP